MDVIHELPEPQTRMWDSDGIVVSATGSRRMLDVLRALPLRRTRHEALFWMDTFSIPVVKEGCADEEEKRDLKKRAIDSMAQIYAGAIRVLVLDPELQLLPWEHISNNTLLALYVKISPWMARSWPLQEGALTENLVFRFRDYSVPLVEISHRNIGLPALRMLDFNAESELQPGLLKDLLPSRFTSRAIVVLRPGHVWLRNNAGRRSVAL